MVPVPGGAINYFSATVTPRRFAENTVPRGARSPGRGRDTTADPAALPKSVARRPLGFLLAWLAVSDIPEDKECHHDEHNLKKIGSAEEQAWRQELRDAFRLLPGAGALLEMERAPFDGEDEPLMVR